MAGANELTITVLDPGRIEARTGDGAVASGKVNADPLRLATVQVLANWVRRSPTVSRAELEVLGEHLFEMLFEGEVRKLLLDRVDQTGSGAALRLQLVFTADARELAHHPWEYLLLRESSGRKFFLSTYTQLVLSRFMPTNKALAPLAGPDESLRILLAAAEPDDKDLGPVLWKPVFEAVHKIAQELTQGVKAADGPDTLRCVTRVQDIQNTTCGGLVREIEDFKPQVVHLLGHGRFDRYKGKGEVALLKSDLGPQVEWVSDDQLMDRFINLKAKPRLVFLHMCEAGEVGFERDFTGVAPKLIAAGVQAVVAMQHPITNYAASRFALEFYRCLGSGRPIDEAVQRGRNAVAADFHAEREFGTPVLYMRASDGIIIPQPVLSGEPDGPRKSGAAGSTAIEASTAATAPLSAAAQPVPTTAPALTTTGTADAAPRLAGPAPIVEADPLRAMRKAGRVEATRLGRLNRLARQIDELARAADPAAARLAIEARIGTADDDEDLVWSAMLDELNKKAGVGGN